MSAVDEIEIFNIAIIADKTNIPILKSFFFQIIDPAKNKNIANGVS